MSNLPRERRRVQTVVVGETRTKRAMARETDVNYIMDRFQESGVITHRNQYEGTYGDYSNVPGDFHAAMNLVVNAQEMFMTVPSSIRSKFRNDPGAFLDFVNDPKNEDEMREMGLLRPKQITKDNSDRVGHDDHPGSGGRPPAADPGDGSSPAPAE